MAAACTYVAPVGRSKLKLHQWTWTTSPDGTLSGLGASDPPVGGRLLQFQAIPTSGAMPTSGYIAKLVDADGFDWLWGAGVVLPSSSDHVKNMRLPFITNSASVTLGRQPILPSTALTPEISGGGDTKSGTFKLWTEDIR